MTAFDSFPPLLIVFLLMGRFTGAARPRLAVGPRSLAEGAGDE